MMDHLSDRCSSGITSPRFSDKVARWRARQKANETEEAKQARLNKERDCKSNQRQKQYQNESLNERIVRQEQAAISKAQQRHIRDMNENDETHEMRMNYEASRKSLNRPAVAEFITSRIREFCEIDNYTFFKYIE
jgi:hypothetical protein